MKDPVDYVLEKLEAHVLVMIGERHWTHEEPMYLQEVLRHCYDRSPINYLYLEFGRFIDQGKVESFLSSTSYDPRLVIEILRDSYELGWGYQEYLDIFRLIYEMNQSQPPSRRVEIILTAGSPDEIDLWTSLQEFLHTPTRMQDEKKNRLVGLIFLLSLVQSLGLDDIFSHNRTIQDHIPLKLHVVDMPL